jgi:hypothetical protein
MRSAVLVAITLVLNFELGFSQDISFSFRNSQCDESFSEDPRQLRIRISQKNISGNQLQLVIKGFATCCVDFEPIAKIERDTLLLGFEETGSPCECTCCYDFEYTLTGLQSFDLPVKFRGKLIEYTDEKYQTFPVKFRIYQNDTIDLTDKYGLKQGIWTVSNDSTLDHLYFVYKDNKYVRKVTIDDLGQRIEYIRDPIFVTRDGIRIEEYVGYTRYIEYYTNGLKKMECYDPKKEDYKTGLCTRWNEKGVLVYHGPFPK